MADIIIRMAGLSTDFFDNRPGRLTQPPCRTIYRSWAEPEFTGTNGDGMKSQVELG
jgi:hypothetical protein